MKTYIERQFGNYDEQVSKARITVPRVAKNLFDYTDITVGQILSNTIGSSVNNTTNKEGGWYSNQSWDVKQGDVLYATIQYCKFYIYNESGKLVEYVGDIGVDCQYTITNVNAKYMKISANSNIPYYTSNFAFNINAPVPINMLAYGNDKISLIPQEGKTVLDKGFVLLNFDAFANDDRVSILNEFGLKANGCIPVKSTFETVGVQNEIIDCHNTLMANGWGEYVYSKRQGAGYIGSMPDWANADNISDNPTSEVQAQWDAYVKFAKDICEVNKVYEPIFWGSVQGKSCVGFERALKKYGFKMLRGGNAYKGYDDTFHFSVLTGIALQPQYLEQCIDAMQKAADGKYGITFVTHLLHSSDAEANSNNGMTETALRTFLTSARALVDEGKLEFVTYDDIYHRYFPNDAYARDMRIINRRMAENIN